MIAITIITRKICLSGYIFLWLLGCFLSTACEGKSAVTYTFDGAGRFGDCVMIYCKAKYYATKHDMSLLYKPFPFSDQLKLHNSDTYWTQALDNEFHYKKLVKCARDIDANISDTLFIVDLFTSLSDIAPLNTHKRFEPVDHWINLFSDEIFQMMQQESSYKSIIKDMLIPNRTLTPPIFPQGHISVAVHVRKGGGVDGSLRSRQLYSEFKRTSQKVTPESCWVADCACPLRFPPDQFYIDQINTLSELVGWYPLYVQIFTDDAFPQDVLCCFQKHCHGAVTVTLGTCGSWRDRTIEDIYMMSKFDCLIRPCSFFSGVAQLMGDHKLIVRPEDFCWDDQTLFITDMVFTVKHGSTVETIRVPYEQRHDKHFKNSVCDVLGSVKRDVYLNVFSR